MRRRYGPPIEMGLFMNLSTRRRLLKTGLASALFAASGAPVAASPRRGGCLRLAIDAKSAPPFGLPAGCDPEFTHLAIYAGVFETLVEIAPDGMLHGEVAEQWHGSPDARIWSFGLRDGVRFHDGTPLTAEHVALSLNAQRGDWALRNVASIDATDRMEVRIELSAPDTSFPFLLGSPEFAIHSGTGGSMPQGTGPYRVTQYQPDDGLKAERWEQAHNSGDGHFDRIEVLASGSLAHHVRMLRSGRVDALAEIAPSLAPQQFPVSEVRFGRISNARFLVFDLSQVAQDSQRLRLKTAINAEAMVKDVLLGYGRPLFSEVSTMPKDAGPPIEIGVTKGPGFDETAARLVASLARTAAHEGISFCSGGGAHGSVKVRWARRTEAQMLLTDGSTDRVVILAADALGLVSDRLLAPVRTSSRFPLDDTRIARRWWLA